MKVFSYYATGGKGCTILPVLSHAIDSVEQEASVGIFFVSQRPVVPEIQDAIRAALLVEPHLVTNAEEEAAHRTVDVVRSTATQFQPLRFFCALLIAGALLAGAIWTAQYRLLDISKQLMNSFAGFCGIVLGLLGGESQKSTSS